MPKPTKISDVAVTHLIDGTIAVQCLLTGSMSAILWTLDLEARNWQLHRDIEAQARVIAQESAIAIDAVDIDGMEYLNKVDGRFTFRITATGFIDGDSDFQENP